jgi:hypothetical protein
MAQIQIEGDFLASSFSILEEQPMDMLLGKLEIPISVQSNRNSVIIAYQVNMYIDAVSPRGCVSASL